MKKLEEKVILSVETATKRGSVAILRGENVLAGGENAENLSLSKDLPAILRNLLKKAAIEPISIDLLCFVKGPGSFTGLRVGLATMRGLSLALNVPLIGVATLEILAESLNRKESGFILFSAGREMFYGQVWEKTENGELPEKSPLEMGDCRYFLDRQAEFPESGFIFEAETFEKFQVAIQKTEKRPITTSTTENIKFESNRIVLPLSEVIYRVTGDNLALRAAQIVFNRSLKTGFENNLSPNFSIIYGQKGYFQK